MKFTNPANGHTEQVLGTFHWLWCFLWTPIYYAVKGIWTHAIVSLLIGWLIGGAIGWAILFMPVFIVSLIYAFLNKSIVRSYYLRKGWIEESGDLPASPATGG